MSGIITVGQQLLAGLEIKDEDGLLADLGGGDPTCTVTLPDGTTDTAAVTRSSTGVYAAVLLTTQVGRHLITWTGSGANSAGLPYQDVADVTAATDPGLIISLAAARAALNLPAGTTADDDEIRFYISSVRHVIESITGPVLPATRVQTLSGDASTALPLGAYPRAITSVVEDGDTLTAATYAVGEGGILWRRTGAWSDAYPSNIVVTYTVGVPDGIIPPNILHAATEELRFLWQIGQVAARPALGVEQAPGGYVPMGYAVPHRVRELLAQSIGAYGPVSMP